MNYPDEELQERLKSAKIVSWTTSYEYSGGRIHVEYWLPPNAAKVEKISLKPSEFDLF